MCVSKRQPFRKQLVLGLEIYHISKCSITSEIAQTFPVLTLAEVFRNSISSS
jgi:hypothetical protein